MAKTKKMKKAAKKKKVTKSRTKAQPKAFKKQVVTMGSLNVSFSSPRIVRVLVAKPGLDGHDRGAKVVARGLRDEGFEVIYTGLHQTPEMIVQAAIQEDVDIIGLSILSGAHIALVRSIQDLLKKEGVKKPIFVGGIIPPEDVNLLLKSGIQAVFGPGSTMKEIAEKIRHVLK